MKYLLVSCLLGLTHSLPFQDPREVHQATEVRREDPGRLNLALSRTLLTQRTSSLTNSPPSDAPLPKTYHSNFDGFETSGISPWSDNGRSEMLDYQVGWAYCPRRWVNCRKCPRDPRCLGKSAKDWDWSWGTGGGNEGTPGKDGYDIEESHGREDAVHGENVGKTDDSGDKYADSKTFDTPITIEAGHGAVQVPGADVDSAGAD